MTISRRTLLLGGAGVLAGAGVTAAFGLAGGDSSPVVEVVGEHQDAVLAVAFSPDGKTLATAGADRTVHIWPMAKGVPGAVLTGHAGAAAAVAWSPDGRVLAVADTTAVYLWDVAGRRRIRTFDNSSHSPSVAFTPRTNTLAATGSRGEKEAGVWLWNWTADKDPDFLPEPGHSAWTETLAISPDGGYLAMAAAEWEVYVWDLRRRINFRLAGEPLTSVLAFSPDGRTLASAGMQGSVVLWDYTREKYLSQIVDRGTIGAGDNRDVQIKALAYRPDGRILADGNGNGTVQLWDLGADRLAHTLTHPGDVNAVAFSPDGRTLVSAGSDREIRMWTDL
ncbi:WD40 repeat domain-containing protein [Herbidospora yilanensis]|uniref:WD40 repeat domain-containing protein n=1 Tax=Herbidospora yilanensis TaxID=354426 RepID=UPI0007856A1A|nr:WD40 repeat domain-containing protein [Herbidospora yilanensis]